MVPPQKDDNWVQRGGLSMDPRERQNLAKAVRSRPYMLGAWKAVLHNGLRSKSERTHDEVKAFAENAWRDIEKIQRKLQKKTFEFEKPVGIAIEKTDSAKKRPLVVSRVSERIVQRAILDVLCDQPRVRTEVDHPHSFGGVTGRDNKVTFGARTENSTAIEIAIRECLSAIGAGHSYFIRSDISDFFTKIPRPKVLKSITDLIDADTEFTALLDAATSAELINVQQLKSDLELFPTPEIGVAQGCSLSPFLGNFLLREFDVQMNSGACICLRYIDDFIIFGPDKRSAWEAFRKAENILSKMDMTPYNPRKDSNKAECGSVTQGLTFLGIELQAGLIRPAKKARKKFGKKITSTLNNSLKAITSKETDDLARNNIRKTLDRLDGLVRGWGSHYYFCNEPNLFKQLDESINDQLQEYFKAFRRLSNKASDEEWQKIVGVSRLVDGKSEPLEWPKL